MAPSRTRSVALAALVACASLPAVPAHAGVLVAQMAQVETVPELPPLEDAPEELGPSPAPEPSPAPGPSPAPDRADDGPAGPGGQDELPATGTEPLVAALAGLGLVVAGLGLRRTTDDLLGP